MTPDRRRRRIRGLWWRLAWHFVYPPLISDPWTRTDDTAYKLEVAWHKKKGTT